jgi:3-dehydroquinate dehydratase II
MSVRLMILNGSNLDLLGTREPQIYGTTTLAEVEKSCRDFAPEIGATVAFHQSNYEGKLIELIHEARGSADAIVINPAGYSFSSVSIVDALKAFPGPVVEIHISNIHARDELHRHSIVSTVVRAVICGAGTHGYLLAMQAAARMVADAKAKHRS